MSKLIIIIVVVVVIVIIVIIIIVIIFVSNFVNNFVNISKGCCENVYKSNPHQIHFYLIHQK